MLYALLAILAGGMAYVRLAPDDPARWHVRPVAAPSSQGWVPMPPGVDPVVAVPGGAAAAVTLLDSDPAEVLARLDAIALATPRTRRLAGSPVEGRVTWVTHSAFFGFPDYTTAEARRDGPATALAIHARQRYGRSDAGVNAARLRDWLARLSSR